MSEDYVQRMRDRDAREKISRLEAIILRLEETADQLTRERDGLADRLIRGNDLPGSPDPVRRPAMTVEDVFVNFRSTGETEQNIRELRMILCRDENLGKLLVLGRNVIGKQREYPGSIRSFRSYLATKIMEMA